MHKLSIPPRVIERVIGRAGRPHPFDVMVPAKTAFVVVDMQNYFMKPGFQGEVPTARAIVPAVNRFAAAVRELGGHVVWVKNATNDTRESWSVLHDWLLTPERRDRRYASMDLDHEGHALWAELDARPEDAQFRLHPGFVRPRDPSARARHRYADDRRDRHSCVLREHRARRHDAEFQGRHGARRTRDIYGRAAQRVARGFLFQLRRRADRRRGDRLAQARSGPGSGVIITVIPGRRRSRQTRNP